MDTDSQKKLKQFWQKRLLFGLGTVGFLGLGVGTIGLMRSTYDDLQIAEGRHVPERFYQEQIAVLNSIDSPKPPASMRDFSFSLQPLGVSWRTTAIATPCDAVATLAMLKDERAIAVFGNLLRDDENRSRHCSTSLPGSGDTPSSIYNAAAGALGKSKQPEAVDYLKNALVKSTASTGAVVDHLEIMKALSQSAQVDERAHDLIIRALPRFRDIENVTSYLHGELIASSITNMLLSSFKGRTLDLETIQAITSLSQDHQVKQHVLLGIFNALQKREQKQDQWLMGLLYVQMLRRGPDDQIRQSSGNPRVWPDLSDPRVTPAILDFIKDKNVPDDRVITFLRESLAGKPKYRFFKEAAIKVGRIKIEPGRRYDPRNDFDDPEHPTRMSSGNTQPIVSSVSNDVNQNDLSQREYLFLLRDLGMKGMEGSPENFSTLAKAALSKSAPSYLKQVLTNPVLKKDEATQPTELEGYLGEKWRAPCAAASALLYQKDSSGVQTCLQGLKSVAAKQYGTEAQRFHIVERKGGYMPHMRWHVDNAEYQFSAIDAAMFSLVYSLTKQSAGSVTIQHKGESPNFHTYPAYFQPLLVTLLKESDVEIRRAAMFTLLAYPEYHLRDTVYTSSFISALEDADPTIREYALHFLRSKINDEISRTFEQVLKNDGYSTTGSRQTMALGGGYLVKFSKEGVFFNNDREISPDNHYVSYRKIEPALRQNPHYMKLVEAIKGAIHDPQPKVRQAAMSGLADTAHDFTKDSLLEMLHDSSPKIRVSAIKSLCLLGEAMLSPIVSRLPNRDDEVRGQAAKCLADWVKYDQVNDQRIAPALIPALNKQPQIILKTLEILADRGQLTLDEMQARQAIPILLKISKNSNDSNLNQISAIRVLKAIYEKFPVDKVGQDRTYLFLNLQGGMLAGIGITSLVLLFSSLRLRNPFPLMWTGYLIFPEEIVAELMALKQRRQAEKVAPRRIRLELAYEVLLLFWAVHVQMRIDNLNLPPGGNDRAK